MTTSQYDATLTTFSPASTSRRARGDKRSGSPSAHNNVAVSRRCSDLAPAPERFGLFISQRSVPALGHLELPPHRPERRGATLAHGHELRDRTSVPLDDNGLAIFDQVEQLRQLRFGAVDADVHPPSLVHFLD